MSLLATVTAAYLIIGLIIGLWVAAGMLWPLSIIGAIFGQ